MTLPCHFDHYSVGWLGRGTTRTGAHSGYVIRAIKDKIVVAAIEITELSSKASGMCYPAIARHNALKRIPASCPLCNVGAGISPFIVILAPSIDIIKHVHVG